MFPLGAFLLAIGYAFFYTGLANVNVVGSSMAPIRLQDALGFKGDIQIRSPWAGLKTTSPESGA